jgi:hypothetical protein
MTVSNRCPLAPQFYLKNYCDHPSQRGVVAMMNSDDCRKRASECLKAAELSSDPNREQSWRKLSDLWLIWSDVLGRLPRADSCSFHHGPARQLRAELHEPPVDVEHINVGRSTPDHSVSSHRGVNRPSAPTAAATGVFLNPWRVGTWT